MGGGCEMPLGGTRIANHQQPAEIEVGDLLIGILRERFPQQGDCAVGSSRLAGENKGVNVELRGWIAPAKERDAAERQERETGE
jgi:hypothetical protein